MNRRDALILLAAFAVTIGLFVALGLFVANYWDVLPAWLGVPLCIVVAAVAIGSPIYSLARISNRMVQRQLEGGDRVRQGESGESP